MDLGEFRKDILTNIYGVLKGLSKISQQKRILSSNLSEPNTENEF